MLSFRRLTPFLVSIAAALSLASLAGCGGVSRSVQALAGGHSATIPQSMLGARPCLTRAVEAQFGVVPEVLEDTTRWNIRLTVKPAGGGVLRYVLRPIDSTRTRVRYEAEGTADQVRPLDAGAFGPIAQCAGVLDGGS